MFKYLIFAFVLMFASVSYGQTVDVIASWTAPTTGSPVATYILQLSVDGGPFIDYATTTETSVTVTLDNLRTYVARVAAIDSLGRQGPWSAESDPYLADLGLPGQPGKPLLTP